MSRNDDEHYKQWPLHLTDQEMMDNEYLQSLTPVEELAVFLVIRGACWQANGRLREAQEAFAQAARLAPHCQLYQRLAAGGAPALAPPSPVAAALVPPMALPTDRILPAARISPNLEPNPLHHIRQPTH